MIQGIKDFWQFIENDKVLKPLFLVIFAIAIICLIVVWFKAFNSKPTSITKDSTGISNEKSKTFAQNSNREEVLVGENSLKTGLPKDSLKTNNGKTKRSSKTNNMKDNDENKSESKNTFVNNGVNNGIQGNNINLNFPKEEDIDNTNIPLDQNYNVKYDNNIFQCQPKVGKWVNPYIGVDFSEKDKYSRFSTNSPTQILLASGITTTLPKVKLWGNGFGVGLVGESTAATNKYYVSAEFSSKPELIIFGDAVGQLYIYNTSTQKVSIFKF